MSHSHDPPYDGKPCIVCPHQVRNLLAVATNLVNAASDGRSYKVPEQIEKLRDAVEALRPFADAHFADRAHSHGDVGLKGVPIATPHGAEPTELPTDGQVNP